MGVMGEDYEIGGRIFASYSAEARHDEQFKSGETIKDASLFIFGPGDR